MNNEVLGSAWALTLSFILWNVWKERNNRIFKNIKKSSQFIYDLIIKHINKTVITTIRNLPSNPPSATNWRILCRLELQDIIPQGLVRKVSIVDRDLDVWHPPPKGFLKFNIDGASKGNLSKAGHGGVLRDNKGDILCIFHGHLGKATNNLVELIAMEQCLEFLVQENRQNMIMEADSALVINSVKRISSGTKPKKASSNWRLIQVFQRIQIHLQRLRTVSFAHVRRKANKLADLLANQGVIYIDNMVVMNWQEVPRNRLKTECQHQANEHNTLFLRKAMREGTVNQ